METINFNAGFCKLRFNEIRTRTLRTYDGVVHYRFDNKLYVPSKWWPFSCVNPPLCILSLSTIFLLPLGFAGHRGGKKFFFFLLGLLAFRRASGLNFQGIVSQSGPFPTLFDVIREAESFVSKAAPPEFSPIRLGSYLNYLKVLLIGYTSLFACHPQPFFFFFCSLLSLPLSLFFFSLLFAKASR